jgi:LacI family transcriptional regulator
MAPTSQHAASAHPAFSGVAGKEAARRWHRSGSAARGAAKTPSLTIDVLVGIPAENKVLATYPLIIKGIRKRAEMETRERPELGEIKVAVQYLPPALFHPEINGYRVFKCRNGGRRGTLFIYPYAESAVEAISQRVMTVSVLESYSRLGIDFIDTDDSTAIASLVGLLHANGHTRIGFVSWSYPIAGRWVARRFSGYAEALANRGLPLRREWVLNVFDDMPRLEPAGVAAAAARHVRESGVTAWVCAADHQAYHLIRNLQAEGLRVPADCSVTGFDGIEPPAGMPRATSMRVPHEHIGSSALTRMVNRIIYPSSPQRKILIESQLIPGETVAPLPPT